MNMHKELLTKSIAALMIDDDGELAEGYADFWAVLVDGGYQGLAADIRAILPTRTRPNGTLSAAVQSCNQKIASDRVIVEHFLAV